MVCTICFDCTETLDLRCCDSMVCRRCLKYFLETSRDKFCFNREGNKSHVIDFSMNEKMLYNIILQNICHEEKLILDSFIPKVIKIQELFSNYEENSKEIMSLVEIVIDIHPLITKISENLPNDHLDSPDYDQENSVWIDLQNINDKGILNLAIFTQIKSLMRKINKMDTIQENFFDLLDQLVVTKDEYFNILPISPDHPMNILVNKEILNDFIEIDFFMNPQKVYKELKDLNNELIDNILRIIKDLTSLNTSENFIYDMMKYLYEVKDLNTCFLNTILTNFRLQNENIETSHMKFLCERNGCEGIMSIGTKRISCPRCHLEHCQNCAKSGCCDPGSCKKTENTFVLCPKCKTGISKVEGCDQMYCVQDNCGYKFDYRSLVSLVNDPRFHNEHEPHSDKNVNENMFVYTNNLETDAQNLNTEELEIISNAFSSMFPEDSYLSQIIFKIENNFNKDILDFSKLVNSYTCQVDEYGSVISTMVDHVIIDVEKGIYSDFVPIRYLAYEVEPDNTKLTPIYLYKMRNFIKLDRDVFNILVRFICDFFVENFPNIAKKIQKMMEDLDDPNDILNDEEFNILISNFMEKLRSRCFEIAKRYEIEFNRKTKLRACIDTSDEMLFDSVLDGVDRFFEGLHITQYRNEVPFNILTNIRWEDL